MRPNRDRWRVVFLVCALLLGSVSALIASNAAQISRDRLIRAPGLFFLLPSPVLKTISLGHEHFLADLIWVQTVLYFSDQFVGPQNYRYLENLLDTVTDLDPRFEKAYLWGGSAFIYNGRFITREAIDRSTRILKKGWDFYNESLVKWRTSPEFWRIPFMIGFNYAIELREKEKGAPYLQAAARFPQAPEYVRTLAATFFRRAGKYEEALAALEEQLTIENLRLSLKMAQSELQRQELESQIRLLYNVAGGKQLSAAASWERQWRLQGLFAAHLRDFSYLPVGFFQLLHRDQGGALGPFPGSWRLLAQRPSEEGAR